MSGKTVKVRLTNFTERRQLLPASDERTRSAESMAFTGNLHAVDNRLKYINTFVMDL